MNMGADEKPRLAGTPCAPYSEGASREKARRYVTLDELMLAK